MHDQAEAYDTVAYPGFAHQDTHPGALAVMAMLYGVEPAPIESCRVLEIGCSEGANLIPLAYALPGAEFVGFDIAGQPVARGQERIRQLGLTNIQLIQADLAQAGNSLGEFDYILAHGIYAWVAQPVRDALLDLCKKHLSPRGIAFISYNTLPGGYIREMVRDILRQGGASAKDPMLALARGIEFLELVAASHPPSDPRHALLQREADALRKRDPNVVFHDEFGGDEASVSFSDFAAHAAAHGLQYLSESTLPEPGDPCFNPTTLSIAKSLSGDEPIALEQALDMVRLRRYRETLLCHAEVAVARELNTEAFSHLCFASRAVSSAGGNHGAQTFTLSSGRVIETEQPTTKAVLNHLIEAWPHSLDFADLMQRLEREGIPLTADLVTLLVRLLVARMVELRTWEQPLSPGIADRPLASAFCRQDAEQGRPRTTTLLHLSLNLENPVLRRCLPLLDGTRDRSALVGVLQHEFPNIPPDKFGDILDNILQTLHRSGALQKAVA